MTAVPPPAFSGARKRALMILAVVVMVVYLCLTVTIDPERLRTALTRLGWSGVGLVLLLSLLNYCLRFQRWHWYLKELGHRLPWGQHFLVYLSGFTFTVSPAKVGEAARGVYLREHGVTYTQTFASLFIERLLDFTAYALLATLIVVESPTYRPFLAIAFAAAAVMLVVAGRPALPVFLDKLSAGSSGGLAKLFAWGAELLRSSHTLLKPRLLLPGLGMGVLSWGAEGLGFWLVCQSLGFAGIGAAAAASIYAISGLAGAAAFFMPGGIGGMEGAMAGLLHLQGAPDKEALIAILMCRLATLWFAVVVGFVCTAVLEFTNWRPAARNSA